MSNSSDWDNFTYMKTHQTSTIHVAKHTWILWVFLTATIADNPCLKNKQIVLQSKNNPAAKAAIYLWLVVESTPLTNISQNGFIFPWFCLEPRKKNIHPWSLTWNLTNQPLEKEIPIGNHIILRFHVKLWWCNSEKKPRHPWWQGLISTNCHLGGPEIKSWEIVVNPLGGSSDLPNLVVKNHEPWFVNPSSRV